MIIEQTCAVPRAEDYVSLRLRSGMGDKDVERSRAALQHSLFTVSLYEGDTLIGFGRVVGDGGITYIVSDIMVDAQYRRRGFARRIMAAIDQWLAENTHEDSYVCLIANRPADLLYAQYGFQHLDEGRCGMMRQQTKFQF